MKISCCLRHLLVSSDRKTLKQKYKSLKVSNQNTASKSKIIPILKKMGYKYQDGLFQIFDKQRWEQASIQFKTKYNVKNCTN